MDAALTWRTARTAGPRGTLAGASTMKSSMAGSWMGGQTALVRSNCKSKHGIEVSSVLPGLRWFREEEVRDTRHKARQVKASVAEERVHSEKPFKVKHHAAAMTTEEILKSLEKIEAAVVTYAAKKLQKLDAELLAVGAGNRLEVPEEQDGTARNLPSQESKPSGGDTY